MSRHRAARGDGYTLVELLVSMVVIGIISATAYSFMNTSLYQYFSLQKQGTSLTEIAMQSQRIAGVLRGLSGITEESADDITCYAYFSPEDTYVSLIHYYKANNNTELLADVTPMTANPPTGTPITADKKTYTIINPFYQVSGVSTFVYLDSSNNVLSQPITDLTTIKAIQVNLAVPGSAINQNSNQQVDVKVSLRNLKSNL